MKVKVGVIVLVVVAVVRGVARIWLRGKKGSGERKSSSGVQGQGHGGGLEAKPSEAIDNSPK